MPIRAAACSAGVKATWTCTGVTLVAVSQVITCYRHPNRETPLPCSECGRPICTECMTMAPVGLRCPDHSGKPRGTAKITQGARRLSYEGGGSIVTKALIGINLVVYLFEIASGGLNGPGVAFQLKWALFGPAVAHGDWDRLITGGVPHADPVHPPPHITKPRRPPGAAAESTL